MKVLVLIFFALLIFDPGKTSKINSLKNEAHRAFEAGDYKTAISKYHYLIDSLGVTEETVRMDLAHAYFKSKDTLNATDTYKPLTASSDNHLRSLANQQLGVLANRQGKTEDALNYFKQSLKAAPANDEARYNYEMVKKKLSEQNQSNDKNKDNKDKDQKNQDKKDQKDQKDQDQKNKDQQNKDQQNKDQKKDQEQKDKEQKDKEQKDQQEKDKQKKEQEKKDAEQKKADDQKKQDQEQDKKDIPPSIKEKLKDMQMSEEKAKMILEAMRNLEKQYLQQNKRKATKPKERGKPDW